MSGVTCISDAVFPSYSYNLPLYFIFLESDASPLFV